MSSHHVMAIPALLDSTSYGRVWSYFDMVRYQFAHRASAGMPTSSLASPCSPYTELATLEGATYTPNNHLLLHANIAFTHLKENQHVILVAEARSN